MCTDWIGWTPFKVTENAVNVYASDASDCTGTHSAVVSDESGNLPEWIIQGALMSDEAALLASISTPGECVGPFKGFKDDSSDGPDTYLKILETDILPPYLGEDPSGGGASSVSVTGPSGTTYDIKDLCENAESYSGPSAQVSVSCADWRAIGASFLPGTDGCGLTWTSMCTFDGSLVSDSPTGAQYNDFTFLMEIGDPDKCCEYPICELSECYNPCSTAFHFRPQVTASAPHCIGDEVHNPIAQSQSLCEATCHTGSDGVQHCCEWDPNRADPNAVDYDPCHCHHEDLCQSSDVGGVWSQRTLTCGGNMQISAEYTNPSNPTMREQCCHAEDPTQVSGGGSGGGGDGGSDDAAPRGLHLTGDSARIIFGEGNQACKLELKQRTGDQSGFYLASSCPLN